MKIGLVTCEKLPLLSRDDQKLIPLFTEKGIKSVPVVWNDPQVNWNQFDHLIIRSVWDYHLNPEGFLDWLGHLEKLNVKTLNPISVLRNNHNKFYLQDLEMKGVRIVPTLFFGQNKKVDLSTASNLGWKKVVLKPAISASAHLTNLVDLNQDRNRLDSILQGYSDRDLLVQKYMPEIQETGELSIIFLNRRFSHAVIKKSAVGEFRIQSEFGGVVHPFSPESNVLETAQFILSLFDVDLLYARVDGILKEGVFVLMEIELIEPDLFLGFSDQATEKFVSSATSMIHKNNLL